MTGRPRLSQGQRRKGEMKDLGPTVSPCSNEHCPRDGRLVNISKSGSSLGKKSCIKSEIIYVWKNLLSTPCRDQGCLLCLDRLCLKKKMQNICIFLWSYIFLQALFCNFLFLSSKIMQSTCTPMLLPDRYLISSHSLQKLGMVTPQFSQASKTVHPPEGGGILKFCAPLLYPRIMTQANLSWTLVLPVSGMTVVICHWFWTPTQANFNKHNSFTETCKQPRHWSSQMESCLYHTL